MAKDKKKLVLITVDDQGEVELLLQATDDETVYLTGLWKVHRVVARDIYEDEDGSALVEELLGKKKDGKFTREKRQTVLRILCDKEVKLFGVGIDNGLAFPANFKGSASTKEFGTQKWTARPFR